MNISINEIAYDVIELYRANYKDTDSLSRFQVYHWINVARAFLIQQRLITNMFAIYPEEIQVIPELVVISAGSGLVKSTLELPATLHRRGYHGTLTRVGLPYESSLSPAFNDGPVQIVDKKRFVRSGNRKFNSGFYFATVDSDKKLYLKPFTLVGLPALPGAPAAVFYIQVEGVFQNPIEVMILNGETDPYNADYPINMELLIDLKKVIVNDHFKSILQQLEDKTNEGRDSTNIDQE